jgi:hypothetical protein
MLRYILVTLPGGRWGNSMPPLLYQQALPHMVVPKQPASERQAMSGGTVGLSRRGAYGQVRSNISIQACGRPAWDMQAEL